MNILKNTKALIALSVVVAAIGGSQVYACRDTFAALAHEKTETKSVAKKETSEKKVSPSVKKESSSESSATETSSVSESSSSVAQSSSVASSSSDAQSSSQRRKLKRQRSNLRKRHRVSLHRLRRRRLSPNRNSLLHSNRLKRADFA